MASETLKVLIREAWRTAKVTDYAHDWARVVRLMRAAMAERL